MSYNLQPEVPAAPPLGGYRPERVYDHESEWVRGDPSPLGLICFGMTTSMLMFTTTLWSDSTFLPVVVFYAIAFGGTGQLLAGMLDLIKGNTFGGTVFSSYGCFWIGWGMLVYNERLHPGEFGGAGGAGMQLYFGLWAILTLKLAHTDPGYVQCLNSIVVLVFFISSLRKTGSIQVVLSTLVVTFVLLCAGVNSPKANQAAGYFGAFCAGSALYAAFIILIKVELGYLLPGIHPTLYFKHPLDERPEKSSGQVDVALEGKGRA